MHARRAGRPGPSIAIGTGCQPVRAVDAARFLERREEGVAEERIAGAGAAVPVGRSRSSATPPAMRRDDRLGAHARGDRRVQAGLHRDDRIDLDRGAERQHRHADRAAGVAAGLAEHLLHQLGGAVGDLGLIGEAAGAVHEHAELHDPLDPVEADRLVDLGEQHDAAGAGGADAELEVAILAEPAGDAAGRLARLICPEMWSRPLASTAGT